MDTTVITSRSLRGEIAKWAVQLSPYWGGPEHLDEVLAEVARRFEAHPRLKSLLGLKYIEVPQKLADIQLFVSVILSMPDVDRWGQRRNGRKGMGIKGVGLTPPDPDDDFIDLDALTRNISVSILTDMFECEHMSKLLMDARG